MIEPSSDASRSFARLAAIMVRLRDPEHGCAWDRAQTFASIAPYTIEEAYEVADAVQANDLPALRDELGDLLLQVVFHARLAEEVGAFTLADVCTGIADKMERRHPHVFADAVEHDGQRIAAAWEDIKAAERGSGSAMDGVARALPSLMRAAKIGRRAARVGFDWHDMDGVRGKLLEELDELAAADTLADCEEEVGDLLFTAAQLARHVGIDPEIALARATDKFEARFRSMEERAMGVFAELTPAQQGRLWDEVKRAPDAKQ